MFTYFRQLLRKEILLKDLLSLRIEIRTRAQFYVNGNGWKNNSNFATFRIDSIIHPGIIARYLNVDWLRLRPCLDTYSYMIVRKVSDRPLSL